jgi:hypothetical protein
MAKGHVEESAKSKMVIIAYFKVYSKHVHLSEFASTEGVFGFAAIYWVAGLLVGWLGCTLMLEFLLDSCCCPMLSDCCCVRFCLLAVRVWEGRAGIYAAVLTARYICALQQRLLSILNMKYN